MKKLLIVLLVFCLCGCKAKKPKVEDVSEPFDTEETETSVDGEDISLE